MLEFPNCSMFGYQDQCFFVLFICTLIESFFNIRSVIDRDYENEEYVLILKLNVLTVDIGIK